MKYLIVFILVWTGFLGASPGNSDEPDGHAVPEATQPASNPGSSDENTTLLDRALEYKDPKQFLADLKKNNIDRKEAEKALEQKLAETQDPAEKARLETLLEVLKAEEAPVSQKEPSLPATTPSAQGPRPTPEGGAGAAAGLASTSTVQRTARAVDAAISLRVEQIINAIVEEAKHGPLSPERVQHYERQIANLPADIQAGVGPLLASARDELVKARDARIRFGSSNPLAPFSTRDIPNVESEMRAIGTSYLQSVSQAQGRAREYLSVASTQATSTLLQARNLTNETRRFSNTVTDANDSAAEKFRERLESNQTVDTGELGPDGKPIRVLPTGEIAEGLRSDFANLAEGARQRSSDPELQQRVQNAFEQARRRFGEERVNNILAAAARGADIAPLLPQGPENARARLELQELARTATNLQRVDASVLSTAALGSQIIDEKQFKTFRNESGFEDRARMAGNVDSLAQKAEEGIQEALGLMREQGIVTNLFSILGPDSLAMSIRNSTLGQAPNGWLPASDLKLRDQATELRPVIERLRLLGSDLARTQTPEEFGRVYDDILHTRKDLQHRVERLERTARGYVGNAQLTKSLAVTAGAIAAGSLTGGTATGVILAATASSTLRGGIELVDGATSKKGVDWTRVRNEGIMGVVDVVGGAAATKAANFTHTVLAQSLKNASPAVRGLAYLGNYAVLEGGTSGGLSGGVSAYLEGKSIMEGAGQGFLWGTLIGGGVRSAQLARSGGVPKASNPTSSAPKPKVLDSYPDGAVEAAERVARSRGVKVTDLSEAELHTIGQRELEISDLMRDRGLSYDAARSELEKVGFLLSGPNSLPENKLVPLAGGGRAESLHRVASRVVAELPENFHSLPYAERVKLAREQIQRSYQIAADKPFVSAPGKTQGLLLDELSQAIANLRPIPTVAPRYRSVPVSDGPIDSVASAQRLLEADTRGGFVHTSTLDGALGFNSGSGQRAVFIYPEGTPGTVVNGKGSVFEEGRAVQGTLGQERAAAFADNDWILFRDGQLRVSRLSQEADGTTMIFLERQPVSNPQERLRSAVGSEPVTAPVPGRRISTIEEPHQINLNRMGARQPGTETVPLTTLGEAVSEAKWRAGITRSQQPTRVHTVEGFGPNGRTTMTQEVYEVDLGDGAGRTQIVINTHEAGGAHKLPHVEVGIPKPVTPGATSEPIRYYGNKLQIFFTGK